MKKYFIICLIWMFACKKEGGSGKQLYLSKIFVNELLAEEYIYSSDMNPVRKNFYNTGSGQSVFGGFRLYEYEDGMISKVLQFNKDSDLSDKKELKYNEAKKITRLDKFGNDETLDGYSTFEYDNNKLSKMINYSVNPVKKTGEWQFTVDAQNNVVSLRRYFVSSGNLIFNDSVHFTWSNKTSPAHWRLYEQLIFEFPVERTIESLFADSLYYYMIGTPPITALHTFTQKAFNAQGYIISQQYKLEGSNFLGGTTTTNYNLKYEYVE